MTTAAEQYRQLVKRLQTINEELKIGDIDPRNGKKILSAMTDSDGNVVRSGTGEIWNVKYGEAEKKPEPAAVAEPVKDTPAPAPEVKPQEKPEVKPEPTPEPTPTTTPAEVKPEEKCGPEVKEKIKQQKTFNSAYAMARQAGCPDFDWCQIVTVPGQAATPVPGKVDFTGQATPLGGDAQNPMSFAPNSNFGAEEGYASDDYILEDELNRVREIAGTQVVVSEAGAIPEIKAASKQAAIEIARKKGIKRFRFCGKYKVQAKKPGQAATPATKPSGKVDFTGQATPLGGDAQNPMSFAPNSNFGA